MEKNEIKILKLFGPSVMVAKIPNGTLDALNNYIDVVVEDKKKSSDLDYGNQLVGDVTQEFRLDREIIEKSGWGKFLAGCVNKWVEVELKKKITKFELMTTWVVRQFENEYNPIHWHSGHISGAGFLKLPETFGKPYQKNKQDYRGGNLELIHGNRMFLSQCRYPIKPKVGDFYFFPHYLMHTVYPFKGTKEERRSISFNGLIDSKIFNIFG